MDKCAICGMALASKIALKNFPLNTFEVSDQKITLQVGECNCCGAVQLINTPLSDDYLDSKNSIGISTNLREAKKKKLVSFVDDYALRGKKLVEVGCGRGEHLEIFKEAGIEVVGQGKISTKKKFDCFFTLYYLEHMPDPIGFVNNLFLLLKDGGLGYIEVPNYDYIFKHRIWMEFTKDHRFYYRAETLIYLFKKCGFRIEAAESSDICLTVIVSKPILDKLSIMRDCMRRDVDDFKKLTNELGRFYIYGAGHYAQLMLGLSGVKPLGIFDSNPAKCGGCINGVTVEHGSKVERADAPIVVICAIYNKEVCQRLESLGKKTLVWEEKQ